MKIRHHAAAVPNWNSRIEAPISGYRGVTQTIGCWPATSYPKAVGQRVDFGCAFYLTIQLHFLNAFSCLSLAFHVFSTLCCLSFSAWRNGIHVLVACGILLGWKDRGIRRLWRAGARCNTRPDKKLHFPVADYTPQCNMRSYKTIQVPRPFSCLITKASVS